jgi:hypothetical protein
MLAPDAWARVKAAITVSPAPVTSYTSFVTVEIWVTFSFSKRLIPCSPRVISTALHERVFRSLFPALIRDFSSLISTPDASDASARLGVIRETPA